MTKHAEIAACGAKVYCGRLCDALNTSGFAASKEAMERGEGLTLPACVLPLGHDGGHMLSQDLWTPPESPPSELDKARAEITRLEAEMDETRKDARYIALDGQEWKEMYERAKNRYTGAEAANATLREAAKDYMALVARWFDFSGDDEHAALHVALATPTATAEGAAFLVRGEHPIMAEEGFDPDKLYREVTPPTATAREGGLDDD